MSDLRKINTEINKWIMVGTRPGFGGAANALKGGSTPPPAAILSISTHIFVGQRTWRKRS